MLLHMQIHMFYWYYKSETRRCIKLLERFPGPPKLLFFGNAFDFKDPITILPKLMEFRRKYGPTLYMRLGPTVNSLIFSDPDSFEFFLNSTKMIEKSRGYRFLDRWLGTGLLTAGGSKWKKHRKILTPAFHFKILEDFVEIFEKLAKICIEKLEAEMGKDSFDIYPYINLYTLDVICETAMGVSMNVQNETESEYTRSVKEMCRILIARDQSIIKNFDCLYKFTEDYRKEIDSLKILNGQTEKVIEQRRRELSKQATKLAQESEFGIKKRSAFLDLILQAKDAEGRPALTDVEIKEEVNTFMFAGHDTTGSTISFLVYCLSKYPDVQAKVVREIEEVLGTDSDRNLTYQDIQNLKYLELVIKETLRMYPGVPVIARQLTEDAEYDGKIIPKNTNIGLFFYGIHRDPKIFTDPDTFNPDRFLEMNNRSPFAYVPFSAGPRNCIGQKFSMLEMKTLISKLVMHFEILPSLPQHEVILLSEVVLKSNNGIRIRLKLRK